MVQNGKGDYELNYVYKPESVDDYRSVNVILKVMKKKLNLNIYSQDEISPVDLKHIMNALQKKIINKAGIDIQSDCSIYLFVNEDEYYLEQGDEHIKVYKLQFKA